MNPMGISLGWRFQSKKIPLPQFIEGRARGLLKMENGQVFRRVVLWRSKYGSRWEPAKLTDLEAETMKHGTR